MKYVIFDLTKEEREEINKKLDYIRALKEQNEREENYDND